MAKKNDGIVYQGAPYEGLTWTTSSSLSRPAARCSPPTARSPTINSPQNLKALQFMVNGIKDGVGPQGRDDVHGGGARRGWEAGKASYMRNWTYAYALARSTGAKVKGKFDVAPFPTFEGGGKAASSAATTSSSRVYSKNPGGRAEVHRLLRLARRCRRRKIRQVLARADDRRRSTTTRTS